MTLARKIYHFIVFSNYVDDDIEPDVGEWRAFLNSLAKPADAIDKAYNKYLCKRHMYSAPKLFIMRLFSFFCMIPGYIAACLPAIKQQGIEQKDKLVFLEVKDLDYHDVAPMELFDRYPNTLFVKDREKLIGRLNEDAKALLHACIRRHGRDCFFIFLVYKDMVKHSFFISRYNPAALSHYAIERNIASPIITALYEKQDRRFISFQHGDYMFQMIQGFMQFSEYYVWDELYINMFVNDLRCDPEQFRLYIPGKLKKKWNLESIEPEYFGTYYFSNESSKTIAILADILRRFNEAGKKCKVRLHPRWEVNNVVIREQFKDFYIEEPKDVTMEQSLASTEYAISLASTVLHEAWVEGRKVLIDDVSSPEKYKSLQDRQFIMLKKEHKLLSELIRELDETKQQ